MKKKTENVKGAPFSKSVIQKKRKKKSSCREAKEERIEEENIVLAFLRRNGGSVEKEGTTWTRVIFLFQPLSLYDFFLEANESTT